MIVESEAGAAQGLTLIVTFVIKRGGRSPGGALLQCQRSERAGRRGERWCGVGIFVCLEWCLQVNTDEHGHQNLSGIHIQITHFIHQCPAFQFSPNLAPWFNNSSHS